MSGVVGTSGRRRRRNWSDADRRRIVERSYEPGMSVSKASREFDINANQIFTWRRQLRRSGAVVATAPAEMTFAIVDVAPEATASAAPILLEFKWGMSVRVDADVDLERLTQVIRAVRAAS